MNDDLLSFALNTMEPDERERLEEKLRHDPALQSRANAWKRLAAPLAWDAEMEPVPHELAQRTIDFVLSHSPTALAVQVTEPASSNLQSLVEKLDRGAMPSTSWWRRWDFIAVACMLVLGFGLVLASAPFLRQRQDRLACQNQMRELHAGLVAYSDVHDGQYPQVQEKPPYNTVASVVPILQEAGVVPPSVTFSCPGNVKTPATYAYTLGYRTENGQLIGMNRDNTMTDQDFLPILADRPLERTGNGVSPEHRYGQNVLFVDGHVRFCTSTRVGVAGDEIYVNKLGQVGAGVHRHDTALGYGGDQP